MDTATVQSHGHLSPLPIHGQFLKQPESSVRDTKILVLCLHLLDCLEIFCGKYSAHSILLYEQWEICEV